MNVFRVEGVLGDHGGGRVAGGSQNEFVGRAAVSFGVSDPPPTLARCENVPVGSVLVDGARARVHYVEAGKLASVIAHNVVGGQLVIDGTVGTERSKVTAVPAAAKRHGERPLVEAPSPPRESCGSSGRTRASTSVGLDRVGLGADRFEIV
jgi:hypothetical protein